MASGKQKCVGSKKKKPAEQPVATPKAEEPENPPADAGDESKHEEEGAENHEADVPKPDD